MNGRICFLTIFVFVSAANKNVYSIQNVMAKLCASACSIRSSVVVAVFVVDFCIFL